MHWLYETVWLKIFAVIVDIDYCHEGNLFKDFLVEINANLTRQPVKMVKNNFQL